MWKMPKRFNPKKKTDVKQPSVANSGNKLLQGRDQPRNCPQDKPPWQLRRRLSPIPPGSKEGPGNSIEQQSEVHSRKSATGMGPQEANDEQVTLNCDVTHDDKPGQDERIEELCTATEKENAMETVHQLVASNTHGIPEVDDRDSPDPDDRDETPRLSVCENEMSKSYAEQDEISAVIESTERKLKASHSHADVESVSPVVVILDVRRAQSTPLICERDTMCSAKDISDSMSDQVMPDVSVCVETEYDYETSYFKKSLCSEGGESEGVLDLESNCDISFRRLKEEDRLLDVADNRKCAGKNTEDIADGESKLLQRSEPQHDGITDNIDEGTTTTYPEELLTAPKGEETKFNGVSSTQHPTDNARLPRSDGAKAPLVSSFRSNPEVNAVPELGRANLPVSATTIPHPGGHEIPFEIPAVSNGNENHQEGLIEESAGDNVTLDLSESEIAIHTLGQGDQSRVSPAQDLSSSPHDDTSVREIQSARETPASIVQNRNEEPRLSSPQTPGPVGTTDPASKIPRSFDNPVNGAVSLGDDAKPAQGPIGDSCCETVTGTEECQESINTLDQGPSRKATPSTPAMAASSPQSTNEADAVLSTKCQAANHLSGDSPNDDSQDTGPLMSQTETRRVPSPTRTTSHQIRHSENTAVSDGDKEQSGLVLKESSTNGDVAVLSESKASTHSTEQGDKRTPMITTSSAVIVSPQPIRCESVDKLAIESPKLMEHPADTDVLKPECVTPISHEPLRVTNTEMDTSRCPIKSEVAVFPSAGDENGHGEQTENVEKDTGGKNLTESVLSSHAREEGNQQTATHIEIDSQEPSKNDKNARGEGRGDDSFSVPSSSDSRTPGLNAFSADIKVPDVQSLIDSVIVRRLSTEACKEDHHAAETADENRDASKTCLLHKDNLEKQDNTDLRFDGSIKLDQISASRSTEKRHGIDDEGEELFEEKAASPATQQKLRHEAKAELRDMTPSGLENGETPQLQLLDAFTAMNDAVQAAKLIIRYLGMTDSRLRAALHRAGRCDDRVHKCFAAERIADEAQAFATRTQSVFMTYYRLAEAEDSFRDMVLAQVKGTERERRKLRKWWTGKESREPDIEEVAETSDEEKNKEP